MLASRPRRHFNEHGRLPSCPGLGFESPLPGCPDHEAPTEESHAPHHTASNSTPIHSSGCLSPESSALYAFDKAKSHTSVQDAYLISLYRRSNHVQQVTILYTKLYYKWRNPQKRKGNVSWAAGKPCAQMKLTKTSYCPAPINMIEHIEPAWQLPFRCRTCGSCQ